jgi:transposase
MGSVLRPRDGTTFALEAQINQRQWIVERTFAWLGNYRRLARDYEINPRTSEAWIKNAMIHLMVRRLA